MKSNKLRILGVALYAMLFPIVQATELSKEEVVGVMEKSAAYHIANPKIRTMGKNGFYYQELPAREWHTSAYYDGLIALSCTTGNPQYLAEVLRHGYSVGWTPNPPHSAHSRFNADDHAVGHAWLDCYMFNPQRSERLAPFKLLFDEIIKDAESKTDTKVYTYKMGSGCSSVYSWTWCDSLFMAPPTLARLYKITGDEKYLDYMDSEFQKCENALYDKSESLFYRDPSFIGKKSPAGAKIFWSRGNGWVVGGLAQIIEFLPDSRPTKAKYVKLFGDMMSRIGSLQGSDGLWTVNLADSEHIKGGETSGSAFFVYALAWGINNGYLGKDKYYPMAIKGWKGLLTRVLDDGMVGYVQPVGAAPDTFDKTTTHAYGAGAFFMAGCEIAKMEGMQAKVSEGDLMAKAQEIFDAQKPQALAHIEPRRKGDVAWENDKMAFRVFGPELKKATENSGIDVWYKRVTYPIINKWYDAQSAGKGNYHKDSGEGCDMFKVADTVGLGGTGIWKNSKLYKSNVYIRADVIWTSPDSVKIKLWYEYDVEGQKYLELKTIELAMGKNKCYGVSRFSIYDKNAKKWVSASEIEIAVGIFAQNNNAEVSESKGRLQLQDKLEGKIDFKAFIEIKGGENSKFEKVAARGSYEYLLIAKPSPKNGEMKYSFGYKFERNF